ncbi:polysaccharide pyruvyl transferase family protein [Butyrivibrio sp. XB500-5]|uniref:polysaccharide pyruvyl transferase family protein n=1 Tax=Butyrivibrio sp. XB500-5 TaxID=2364880 RepID=UPI000EA98A57|nr:polysaccharide pyruvyl transferase family protein [Butyrivibrio sp. XB500-5]RKM59560.1 polysaccharide pyruvyl transferase family protein [Butyrivibrio sp. XB500-5]
MRVGIASCYYNRNYGSMLQAYATQKILEKLGHEAVTFQCLNPIKYMTQSKVRYYFHKFCSLDIVKSKIRQYKGKKEAVNNSEYLSDLIIRNEKFDDFYKKYIHLSEQNKTREDLTRLSLTMNAVVVGSDMLWHPINIEHDYFTLTFVPEPVKRISYATSFGTTFIPKYQRKQARDFLNRFNAISVREQSGVKVIEELGVNKPAKVVLDPTLLFSAEEWMVIQEQSPIVKEEYIFCYFLGVNKEHRRMANNLKEKTGLKIVTLPHLDEYVLGDENFGDYQLYKVGPSEFVNLIRNAEYVLTDSFHGTCFSILNHKKFLTFNRFQAGNTQSTNTRIDSLLGMMNLSSRRVQSYSCGDELLSLIEENIDYSIVDLILDEERTKAEEYLIQALK